MGSKKTTTTTHSQGSLPDWLTTPYQQATKAATNLYDTQPGIGAGTQASLDQIVANANAGRTVTNGALNTLNNFAAGNFGQPALTGAANGSYLTSNPWANGGQLITTSSALNGFAANGMPTSVSGALNGFAGNGGRCHATGVERVDRLFFECVLDLANVRFPFFAEEIELSSRE